MESRARINLSTALAYGPIGIIWTFLPIHLRSLGASFLLISLIFFVPALLPPLWGFLLDKFRRGKRIIIVSTLAQALGLSIFPFLSTPEQLVFVAVLIGFFSASFVPVYAALATWASQQYGRAIGGFWASASLGFAVATITGAVIYETYGPNYLFILGACLGYCSVAVTLAAPKEVFYSPAVDRATTQGILRLLRTRGIATVCLLAALILIASAAFNSFFTLYLVGDLGGSKLIAGLAASGTTLLGAIAFRTVGPVNDRLGRRPVFIAGTAGYVAYFIAIYLVKNVYVVAGLWVIPIYPLIQSSTAALVSDLTSPADRGKGLGLLGASSGLGGGIGPLIGGTIADATGTLGSVVVFSLGLALLTLLLSRALLKEQRVQKVVAPPVA